MLERLRVSIIPRNNLKQERSYVIYIAIHIIKSKYGSINGWQCDFPCVIECNFESMQLMMMSTHVTRTMNIARTCILMGYVYLTLTTALKISCDAIFRCFVAKSVGSQFMRFGCQPFGLEIVLVSNKIAKLRRHASRVHFAKIRFG